MTPVSTNYGASKATGLNILLGYCFDFKSCFIVSLSGPSVLIKSHSFFVKLSTLLIMINRASVLLEFSWFCFNSRLHTLRYFMILGSFAKGHIGVGSPIKISFSGSALQRSFITFKASPTLPSTWRAADRVGGGANNSFGASNFWAVLSRAIIVSRAVSSNRAESLIIVK